MAEQIPDLVGAFEEVMKEMGGKGKSKKAARKGGAKAAGKPRAVNKEREMKPCGCGCGTLVAREFAPGHDMRLKSRLRKASAEGNQAAKAELKKRGW